MGKLIDLTGKRFYKLTVISRDLAYMGNCAKWLCKCDCGANTSVTSTHLRQRHTKSCGCIVKKHGLSAGKRKTKIYRAWRSMMGRCYNKNVKRYKVYGERGILVCDRWKNFEYFLMDMGIPQSDNLSLDRIDNNGNYEPSNCRWADSYTQANNKRINRFVQINGRYFTYAQADRYLGFTANTVKRRIYLGWDIDRIINTPIRKTIINTL